MKQMYKCKDRYMLCTPLLEVSLMHDVGVQVYEF